MISILVDGQNYKDVVFASTHMWANSKTGEWGAGLINSVKDPSRVERTGRLGELAFSIMSGLPPNLEYIKHGDNYDFKINDILIDIKTAARKPKYKAGLIKAGYTKDKLIALKHDIYIFSYLKKEDMLEEWATVDLVGYIFKDEIEKYPMSPALMGHHFNKEIPYGDLIPIENFLEDKKIWGSTTA